MDVEQQNQQEVLRLNQRGGRTLSIVDLCLAGTITPRMAALCWMQIDRGASFLTGAVPGGAGKTTLMAALLGFLPAGEAIVTVSDRSVLNRALKGDLPRPAALLAHEIGSGRWFGYIWGRDAADFFRAAGPELRCVTCLHSDDPEQTRGNLLPLGVRQEDLARVGLHLYMHRGLRHGRRLHRVTQLHSRLDGHLHSLTDWSHSADRHEFAVPPKEICRRIAERQEYGSADQVRDEWAAREACLQKLVASEICAWEDVRQAAMNWDSGR